MNDDLLLRAARAYDDLTKYEYYLQLGKKGVTRNVHLRFPAEAFHHAAGLKKLNDSTMLKESRKKIFQDILNGTITYNVVSTDLSCNEVSQRLELISNLQSLLDGDGIHFIFCSNKLPFYSRIDADYLVQVDVNGKIAYLFLSKYSLDSYFCRSLFYKNKQDYTINQPKLTLLYKSKKDLVSKSEKILYGYRREV